MGAASRKAAPWKAPWSVMLDGYAYYRTQALVPAIPGDKDGYAANEKACTDAVPGKDGSLDPEGEWSVYEFKAGAQYGGDHERTEVGWKVTVVARVSVCRQVFVRADDEAEAYDQAYAFLDEHPPTWPEAMGDWALQAHHEIEACEAEEADHAPMHVWGGR
jgi:hypothetical protein